MSTAIAMAPGKASMQEEPSVIVLKLEYSFFKESWAIISTFGQSVWFTKMIFSFFDKSESKNPFPLLAIELLVFRKSLIFNQ